MPLPAEQNWISSHATNVQAGYTDCIYTTLVAFLLMYEAIYL